jgi:hypothetical protein
VCAYVYRDECSYVYKYICLCCVSQKKGVLLAFISLVLLLSLLFSSYGLCTWIKLYIIRMYHLFLFILMNNRAHSLKKIESSILLEASGGKSPGKRVAAFHGAESGRRVTQVGF